MSHHHTKPRSKRQLQVGEMLRHALSDLLLRGDFHNGEYALRLPPITVSEVRVSADLRNATVFVMPLGGRNQEEIASVLNKLEPQMKRALSGKLRLRFMPDFHFKLDDIYDKASKMEELLKGLNKNGESEK